MHGRANNLSGMRFGKLIAIAATDERRDGKVMWICKCDCGNEKTTKSSLLKNGKVKSCGCIRPCDYHKKRHKKHGRLVGLNNRKHPPEYTAWLMMKQRCCNTKCRAYKNYGSRGIKVCDRWLNSFENFISDMGCRPSAKHSIDRTNNNLGYSPENCRWTTQNVQCHNTRRSIRILIDGEIMTVGELAKKLHITKWAVYYRIKTGKYTVA